MVMKVITSIFVEPNKNLLLVGGLFYNVKLNSLLAKKVAGKTCVMPLAGDQGAGLGVYQAYRGDLKFPDNLTWGPRDLRALKNNVDLPEGMVVVDTMDQASEIIYRELKSRGFVNLVRGDVEFGPRALCNTTTLGLPTTEVAEQINLINARTMEMPFAPVVTQDTAGKLFEGVDKIHKSLEYMIVTRDYKLGVGQAVPGAAHYYANDFVYTGRPQITSDKHLVPILDSFNGLLINTSFNYHGVPIVCTNNQIIDTHVNQRKTRPDIQATTIIVTEK
jgi:predicted NodU family carbamoyl transferase